MDIDVSKENIQPLRGGRNLTQLGTALQAQSDVEAQRLLQTQKEEHEAAISSYCGPDPLDPWFNYIQWVEQSYPKHGHEGHMDKLIKDCLQLFEKDERYFQDRRFIKLWIKYIDCLSNPLEIYQRLHNNGIGTECSEMYRAWASYCEEIEDFKKANQVYMLGLQARAQPLDELEQAHMNFQLYFAQRMLHDDSPTKRKAATALAETRSALTSLKSFKRRNITNVPVQRVGDSVRSTLPGVVRQQARTFDNRLASSNVLVNVYQDAPSTSHGIPTAEPPGPASLVQACANVENEKEVGMWTNPKTRMVHDKVVPHQSLPFVPYEDEEDLLRLSANHMAYCVDDNTFTVPLCVPDPPDPTKISCYNKNEVYVGEKEYSLEEIRSRKFQLKKKPTENETQHDYSNFNESAAQCSALETLANCALDAEQDHLGQLMPINIPTLQNITRVTNMHSPGEPKVLVNMDSKELSSLARNDEPPPQPRNHLVEEFDRSLMGNLMHDSVTVNTKEARWELRNLFNDNATVNEPSMVQQMAPPYEDATRFDIHEDRSMTQALSAHAQRALQQCPAAADKENPSAEPPQSTQPTQHANKTAYYEEPANTQAFNFNVPLASTPNVAQLKRDKMAAAAAVAAPLKYSMDESGQEQADYNKKEEFSRPSDVRPEQHTTVGAQGTGLSVIMEATREYNSKSGSSSSGQSTRTNFTGYTTTPYSEKTQNYDSMYNQPTDPKRASVSNRPNGQYQRSYPKQEPEKQQPPYLSHDHQYQKPSPSYNGYQRPVQHYQQNYYQQPPASPGYAGASPGYPAASPGYPSPQPFASPPYTGHGYPSPGHMMSPQHYQHYGERQQHVYHQAPGFQSPPHQVQYQNTQYYQRTAQQHPSQQHQTSQQHQPSPHQSQQQHLTSQQQHHTSQQQLHTSQQHQTSQQHNMSQQQHISQQQHHTSQHQQSPHQPTQRPDQTYNRQTYHQYNTTAADYQQTHAQSYAEQSPYAKRPGAYAEQHFQVYQSPQPTPSYQEYQPMQTSPEVAATEAPETKVTPPKPHKSPTAALRSIRHDQPPTKLGQSSPDVGFSHQFLNFITSRNEPKDNANTPKFTNSPNISQKMHKNLYVSSPEQGQIPPSSGLSDCDSKDGMTSHTNTPIQSAKVTQAEKPKDVSKRQLDFEHRLEVQSEDSRDSASKISSVCSRQSYQSEYGMDVDSENSMECAAFKSTHSISLVETSELPRPADIEFPAVIDPFNKNIIASLLEYVKFPNKTHADGYTEVKLVPKLQQGTAITIGNNKFAVEKQLGKGNYGAVFLCLDLHANKSIAVKYQKPGRPWEFYICQEVKARIKDPFMLPGYMDITTSFIGDNASLFVSEYSKYGSLLDVANKIKVGTSKCINEFIVFLLTAEMLSIVHYLHKAQIIHADIKPDNFLLMKIPAQEWRTPSLQLIDLGCSIDMSLFPEGTSFRELISTEGFTCTEMREGRPWTYQTDLYCLAGTIHVILMGSYMKVVNRVGQWNIDKKLPRYMKVSLWDKVFTTLLNVADCNTLPDLMDLKNDIDNLLVGLDNLGSQLRNFANVLNAR